MTTKAVALLSGGLDSTLAAKLILEQGIELQGLYFSLLWGCCDKLQAMKAADWLKIPLMVIKVQEDYLQVIRAPKYGYGTAMNPCMDCRIYMLSLTKTYMEEIGASFLVTGEVLGQRPMSQLSRPLAIIERDSGLSRRIVRPLSAKLLPPSMPEEEGVVDRNRLLDISGRSRKIQMELARQYGLFSYPTPAGGCSLTDEHFAGKVKDLLAHDGSPTATDMELLTIGRHIRLSDSTKLILGRNEQENLLLEGYADEGYALVRPQFPGPAALVIGPADEVLREEVLQWMLRYTKVDKVDTDVLSWRWDGVPVIREKNKLLDLFRSQKSEFRGQMALTSDV